ncbi:MULTISPECIES: hemerythrin domain-containing protein [Thermoactinomyces]|jgi:iron-sulfur cluster repair protein YtfE (RIC family)|uniref:Hemerythrin domain-containing protein n=1 Tax=Thermoactinomyces daqus TaxID=1329516 RepID=A0A7W1XBQ8_9BACL|nr:MULTISPECIES: hemerythrin domain-containing protein [Thermoactinomyces]MBA4543623.1 hemerythrin domain-containing protein [Thermoactinomyces daqus]MBH8596514.1 hemerythrin domain-containing protein [Thermoactinomyces sp. CICC 10523]MBH8603276.1 hemerythrin domain-containing protein [Thermoactinomyces sp. CICC 10522]MBH8609024.1 hemerythrin domain-containing protein [Thermoactinomyces sp. CICC 10521]
MSRPKYQPKLDLTDWQKTNVSESEKILGIVAPELHSFIEEHASLSQWMDRVREGYNTELYDKVLGEIGHELDHHFLYEEKYILSRLVKHIPETEVGPIYKLKSEHEIIRKHYEEAKIMFKNHDPENPSHELIQKMGLLAYLLKKHIEKEDHYLFPLFSLVLSKDEKEEIARDVKAEEMRRGMESE